MLKIDRHCQIFSLPGEETLYNLAVNEIAKVLSQAIKEGRWVNISYRNKEGKVTFFWIAIKNIIPDKKEIVVDMFNMVKSKDLNCISSTL